MEASKAMRKALKSIDMDLACGAYERLPQAQQKELKAATVDFLYKYCKILKDGLGYSRSGDKYGWRDRWLWLHHRLRSFLSGEDTQGQGGRPRLLEKQGDTESTKPLRDIIDELLEENQRIKDSTRETTQNLLARIEKLERQVKDLQEQLDGRDVLLNIFKKAGACATSAHTYPKGASVPAVEEYKKLTK